MHEQCDGEISLFRKSELTIEPQHEGCAYNLLLAILVARNQVDSFHVSNIHFVAENIREDDLGEILFLLIPIEISL